MSIAEIGRRLRAREVSVVDLVQAAQSRIAERNPALNAFITTVGEPAVARARMLDAELAQGHTRGPLHGIPVAVKDNFLTNGVRTTGGSKIFADYVPDESAAAVVRLEQAGAVVVGKTNMHELAYGITSNNPHYGPVRNPWDTTRIPGGSSGGSGAAVADGIVPLALGSDTGGSVRIPAGYCGCVGLKPTYGLIDRRGCQPLGLTLDHVGPFTTTVSDAGTALAALTQFEPRQYTGVSELRVGVPDNYYFEHSDAKVADAVLEALRVSGAQLLPVRVPDIDELNAIARVILLSEASAVFERYMDRRQDFGADVLALLDQGRLLPATDYVNAQRARRMFVRLFENVFAEIDCLATPTTPTIAPRIGETTTLIRDRECDVRLAATRFMRGINVIGFPAISLPCGLVDGMPVGLQLIARAGEDAFLLGAAEAIETAIRRASLWPQTRS